METLENKEFLEQRTVLCTDCGILHSPMTAPLRIEKHRKPEEIWCVSPDPRRGRAQAGDGPVGVRPPVDREPGAGGRARGHPLLADDPAVPGPVADDGDRRPDAADLGPLGIDLPLRD